MFSKAQAKQRGRLKWFLMGLSNLKLKYFYILGKFITLILKLLKFLYPRSEKEKETVVHWETHFWFEKSLGFHDQCCIS